MQCVKRIDSIHDKILQYVKKDLCINIEDIDIPIYVPDRNSLHNKKILILSGGGIKGIAFIGALKVLHDNKLLDYITTYVGTSVGTIIILLYMIGYTPDELYDFIKCFDIGKLKCIDPLLFFNKYGLDDGTRIEKTLKKFITCKNLSPNITFKEFYQITCKKFVTTTVNLNDMMPVYMSYETHPELPILTAIRMSISIPFLFTPVIYNNNYFVDGGCIDNFPIHMYKDKINDVLGICLIEIGSDKTNIKNLEDYVGMVIKCIISGITFNSVKDFKNNIIQIEVPQTSAINFDVSEETKIKLFELGYNTTYEKIHV